MKGRERAGQEKARWRQMGGKVTVDKRGRSGHRKRVEDWHKRLKGFTASIEDRTAVVGRRTERDRTRTG